MHFIKKIVFASLVLLVSASLWAAQTPEQIVQSVTEQLLTTLKAEKQAIQTDSSHLVGIVNDIIIPHTDLRETSKGVLAKYWPTLTSAQQQAFMDEFEKLLIRTYAVSFRSYDKQTVTIVESRANPANPNRVEVRTIIKEPGKPNLPVNYRFLKEGDGTWKVYDINVENVSLVNSFRSQIGDAISREGFDKMLASMKEKNKEKF